MCALQCAVFDKTLAELKTRVEKIECNKRHKTVLAELQVCTVNCIPRVVRFIKRKQNKQERQSNLNF